MIARSWAGLLAATVVATLSNGPARAEEPAEAPPPAPVLTRAPKLKRFVEPQYPESKRAAGATTSVSLLIDLDATGKVLRADVVGASQPEFDEAAVAAAAGLEFEPAEVDHKPSPIRITYRYRFTLKAVAPPTVGALHGTIVDRSSGLPLPGVSLELRALLRVTSTDEAGRFTLPDLPPGLHVVQITAKGFISTVIEQRVPAGASATVSFRLDRVARRTGVNEELVFRVPRTRHESGTELSTEEARSVPGVMGDALAVVQNLPGVGRAAAGSGDVVVWGSAPAETRVYVDDVPVPALYHRGGLRSVVHDSLVSSVELVPGGFGAQYGRATGGLVRVQTSTIPRQGIHGYAAADLIDASAALMLRPGAFGRSTVAAAGRYSYLDKILSGVATDVQKVVPLPAYWDYIGKWIWRGAGSSTQVTAFGGGDFIERQIPRPGASQVRSDQTRSSFHRISLRHERTTQNHSNVTAMGWLGLDNTAFSANFGAQPTRADSSIIRYGVRGLWQRSLGKFASLGLGIDAEGSRATFSRAGTLSLPAREGDIFVFGQPPGDGVASDRWVTNFVGVAAFTQMEVRIFGGRLRIMPGLRLETQIVEGDRLLPSKAGSPAIGYSRIEVVADPRVRVEAAVSSRINLHAAVGLYHQAPDPGDLSPIFGNPSLGSVRATQVLAGGSLKIGANTSLELEAFYKESSGLTTRSPLASPAVARALVDTGEGRSYGGQLLVRQKAWRGLSGWISYSLLRAQRRTDATSDWRPFDLEQQHVLVAVASYAHKGWEVGARFRFSTGYPRTPVVGTYVDLRSGVPQPVFGAQNSDRLPVFAQLDLHGQKTWNWTRLQLTVFVDILNVTNRSNPEEAVYSYDYAQKAFLTGLPIVGTAGVRLEF